ncbi:MAG: radical SAM protein [Candidatus Omnitrophica bacterium]|nr:radical SAM protein [Candidatus Omnitrophota bacterium]
MAVFPTSRPASLVSSCTRNMHKYPHRVVSNRPLRQLWNSKIFQLQRELSSRKRLKDCFMNIDCSDYQKLYVEGGGFRQKDEAMEKAVKCQKKKLSYLPLSVTVAFSNKCMNKCYHCLNSSGTREKGLIKRHKQELIEEFIPQAHYIEFTGGEPLLNSRQEIGKIIKANPDKKYRISTNGILLDELGYDEIFDKTIFVVSLYGFDNSSYRRITGRDNFSRVYKSLINLIKRGYGSKIFIKYVVYKEAVSGLGRFCGFVKEHPSLKGVTIISDASSGFSVYPAMQEMEKIYKEDIFNWVYCGSSLRHRVANRFFDPLYCLRWQWAVWSCRRQNNN